MGKMKEIATELALINEALDTFADMGASREATLDLMNGIHGSNYELCDTCHQYAGITHDKRTVCEKCELAFDVAWAEYESMRDEGLV